MTKVNLSISKFKGIFLSAFIFALIPFSAMFIDIIVAGYYLGVQLLSAITIAAPVYFIVCFFSSFVASGVVSIYTGKLSQFKNDEAKEAYGTGIIFAILIGALMFLFFSTCIEWLVQFMQISMMLIPYAIKYLAWYKYIALAQPLLWLFLQMLYVDGRNAWVFITSIIHIILNIILAIVLSDSMGVTGISLARLVSILVSIVLLIFPIFISNKTMKFKICFKIKYIGKIFARGLATPLQYLFMFIINLILNLYVNSTVGEVYLPIVSCIILVFLSVSVFTSVGAALSPFVSFYFFENNKYGIRSIMKAGAVVAVLLGVLFTILFIAFRGVLAQVFATDSEVLLSSAGNAILWASLFITFISVLNLMTQYYLVTRHFWLSMIIYDIAAFIAPVVISIAFANYFGIDALSMGWGISYLVSFALGIIIVLIAKKDKTFPLLLNKSEDTSCTYNLLLDKETLLKTNYEICDYVLESTNSKSAKNSVRLFIEESGFQVLGNNKDSKVIVEYSVVINKADKQIRIVCRDNGKHYDITDLNAPTFSLNTYLLTHIVSTTEAAAYATTTSINTSVFEITY